jgi:hypothetical protein
VYSYVYMESDPVFVLGVEWGREGGSWIWRIVPKLKLQVYEIQKNWELKPKKINNYFFLSVKTNETTRGSLIINEEEPDNTLGCV